MREHGEKAGVVRCHCSGCDRDRKEVLALLAKRKSETPSERGWSASGWPAGPLWPCSGLNCGEKSMSDGKEIRMYGDDGTVHASTFVHVEVDPRGKVVAVWFRCQMLPFEQVQVDAERAAEMAAIEELPELRAVKLADAPKVKPVDRTQRMLTDGSPVTEDHRQINPSTGMQKGYIVLTDEERRKGFVRPVRREYVHAGRGATFNSGVLLVVGENGCGALTKMALPIAETYARDPKFYSGTFCVGCRTHLPLEEFVWAGTNEVVGS